MLQTTAERQHAREVLLESDAKALLTAFGIHVPRGVIAEDPVSVREAAVALAPPVVVKVLSRQLTHKSEYGGVRVGLTTVDDIERAAHDILESVTRTAAHAAIEGLLVEEMASEGVELLIGTVHDDVFGPVIAFGLGGVFTEVLHDVTFRALPIHPWDAAEMLQDLAAPEVLDGHRGQPPVDRAAIADLLLAVGGPDGVMSRSDIHSVELNPVIASGDRLVAVDAVIERRTEERA